MVQTVRNHSSELLKFKERMDGGEGTQTIENGDRQTRRRKMIGLLEVGGEWCLTFITLAGWVADWNDLEKPTQQVITTNLARRMITVFQQFLPIHPTIQF